ncbi:unnamed protein product, partial [marine sediment metagenome]
AAQLTLAEVTAIFGGLDDDKSADPSAKDVYLATDTNRLYICFTDGEWTEITGLYLPLAGGTMTGAIAMGTKKIIGLGDPEADQDAATGIWVLAQCSLYLPLAGGTLTGPLIIKDDTFIQMGDTEGAQRILQYTVSPTIAGIILQPGAGNRFSFLALQPKGTSEKSQFSLYNRGVGLGSDYGAFSIELDGDTVVMIYEDVGSPPTPITHLQLANPWETQSFYPLIDKSYVLGSSTKRWYGISAERYRITQALDDDHTPSGITTLMTAGIALTRG